MASPKPQAAPTADAESGIDRLLTVMARLRDPQAGCPWDLEQTFATIVPHTIEEAYEVADAIENGTPADLKEELGDLLLQVVYYAQMAAEEDRFTFDAVAHTIADKMIARHPHVFGGESVRTAAEMTDRWEAQKAAERAAKATADGRTDAPASVLDGVPLALPGLTRAAKLQRRAARVGFDWRAAAPIFDKIAEEQAELAAALASPGTAPGDAVTEELGDLLFSVVNLARHLAIDPEQALRRATAKFDRRFRRMEAALHADGRTAEDADLDELEMLWQRAKTSDQI